MSESPRRAFVAFTATAGVTLLACRAAARWAETSLRSESVTLPGIDLNLTFNEGVAFGVAAGVPSWVLIVVVSAILGALGFAGLTGRLPRIPAALIFGGGIANVVDRLPDGVVTDYIDLGWWPVFNLPDVAITSGAILLFVMASRATPPDHDGDPTLNQDRTTTPRSQL